MEKGYMSQYFTGMAAKVLSAVETDFNISHQHELNGVAPLKKIFGLDKRVFPTKFLYMSDDDDEPVYGSGSMTWYDAREAHPTRTEYRLYYTDTEVSHCAAAGDEVFIGLCPDNTIMMIVAEKNSTICNQLSWLFGIEKSQRFSVRDKEELDFQEDNLTFVSRLILEKLGIQIEGNAESFLEEMIRNFGTQFPSTNDFSSYARQTVTDVCPKDNADVVLMKWMEREELLFRTFEKYLVSERLSKGFADNMDDFFQFALSVLNRRKSRAGRALENHMEQLLQSRNLHYDRNKITEHHARPDFIFPGIKEYKDDKFRVDLLTMLGVKSSCKDRWRQVLAEANKIQNKHLLTLEAAISENQTDEMKANHLQLILPEPIHKTYSANQQKWLMSVNDFMEMIAFNQRAAGLN